MEFAALPVDACVAAWLLVAGGAAHLLGSLMLVPCDVPWIFPLQQSSRRMLKRSRAQQGVKLCGCLHQQQQHSHSNVLA